MKVTESRGWVEYEVSSNFSCPYGKLIYIPTCFENGGNQQRRAQGFKPFLGIQNLEEVQKKRMILPSCNNLGGTPIP